MRTLLFLLFVNWSTLYSQVSTRINDIDMPVASPFLISFVFAMFILLIIFVLIFISYQEKQRKRTQEQHSEHQFLRQCERFGLSANEVFSLRNYLKKIKVVTYPAVFQSVSIFEEAVANECAELIGKWGFTAKAEASTVLIRTIRKKLGYDALLREIAMSSTRNIEVGQQFDLVSAIDHNNRITDAISLESTELALSIRYRPENASFKPEVSQKLFIQYTRTGDGVYTIPVDVLDVDDVSHIIQVPHTNSFDRQQFRDFVRMQVDLPLQCRLLHRTKSTKNAPLGALIENCAMLDISGGGMAFIADEELKKEDRLSLSFTLAGKKYVLKGEVIGVVKRERRGDVRYKHHVEFKDINRADSDAIVRHIFEKQREQLHVNFNELKN